MENKTLCRECGGRCCKRNPGRYDIIPTGWEKLLGKELVIGIDIIPSLAFYELIGIDVNVLEDKPGFGEEEIITIKEDCKVYDLIERGRLVESEAMCGFFYFLRPKGRYDNAKISVLNRSGFNRCVYLDSSKGCILSHDERPYECRKLVPRKINGDFECRLRGIKVEVARRLLRYQMRLSEVAREEARRIDGKVDAPLQEIIESMKENGYL